MEAPGYVAGETLSAVRAGTTQRNRVDGRTTTGVTNRSAAGRTIARRGAGAVDQVAVEWQI
ncbi:MAG: hypothetical protein ACYCW6_29360, partial [Candidatus Xenobia bacterium]